MKARRVRGLDVAAPLADGAQRIVEVRVAELHDLMPAALEPGASDAQHDLRIAAKRLRYVLEVAGFCFGPYAAAATKRVKALQDLLGEIHDCDVMLPRVLAEVGQLRAADAALIVGVGGAGAADVEAAAVSAAAGAECYRGLEVYAAYLQARRAVLHARFLDFVRDLARDGFRARLEFAITERPEPEPELESETTAAPASELDRGLESEPTASALDVPIDGAPTPANAGAGPGSSEPR